MDQDPLDQERPPGLNPNVPHSARVWNYWLGGKDNYPADREVGDKVRELYPGIVDIARHTRAFLGRAVRYLVAEEGIRQFLDIGTGLPVVDNTHEVAQRIVPECRIVYVDNDPLVLVHARALLNSSPSGACSYIDADVRDPDKILAGAAETLDFSQPIGLMMLGILGNVHDDDEALAIRHRLVGALPSGSFLALEDGTKMVLPEAAAKAEQTRAEGGDPYRLRTPAQIARFFDGLELLEPGVVSVSRWRPEAGPWPQPDEVDALSGLARVP
ncbi:SAM-dependent methyltransferase [Spirillospora sp. CA-294931]|uniref:SAM-dependent methyltransferase n=1 Tax=Spirillospora sp. CA-294931 TaxID=3240042 RepID=UPI003D9020C0